MVELGTGLAIVGGSFVGRDLLLKILGPTADYIGEGLKDFTQKRGQNVHRIVEIAGKKLGDRIENSQESVPPRVLKGILDHGSFSDDALTAEYFGGVLASSRSEVPRDDRGAALISLISSLSVYQLRAHYLFYTITKRLYDGSGLLVGTDEGRSDSMTYVPMEVFHIGMALDEGEIGIFPSLQAHIGWGLINHDLIDSRHYAAGDMDGLRQVWTEAPGAGFIFTPSGLGAELCLWANGISDVHPNMFLDPGVQIEPIEGVEIPAGSCRAG